MTGNFKLYVAILATAIFIGVGYWVYNLYQENQRLLIEKKVLAQNVLALQDSTSQLADSLNLYSAFVRDLNGQLEQKKHDYIALEARFAAFIDSIHDAGISKPVITDSTIVVPFHGEKGISFYTGYTFYSIPRQTAKWDIIITYPKPVEISTQLVEDKGIWKFESWSMTPGVTLKGSGTLDSDTYNRLQKYGPVEPIRRFMIGASLGEQGGPAIGYRANNWTIAGHYNLFKTYPEFWRNIYVDFYWSPF